MSRYGRKRISRRDMLKAAGALVGTMAVLGGGAYLLQRLDDEKTRPPPQATPPTTTAPGPS